jgi:hypothetical protein
MKRKIMSEITEALGGDARVVKAKFLMKQIKHNRIMTIRPAVGGRGTKEVGGRSKV